MNLYLFFSALAALLIKLLYDFLPQVRFEIEVDWFWFFVLGIANVWVVYSVIFFLHNA